MKSPFCIGEMYGAVMVHVARGFIHSSVEFVHACFQAGLEKAGCGITKYSSSHSFNPLLLSKSAVNLSVQKVGGVPSLELEFAHTDPCPTCP